MNLNIDAFARCWDKPYKEAYTLREPIRVIKAGSRLPDCVFPKPLLGPEKRDCEETWSIGCRIAHRMLYVGASASPPASNPVASTGAPPTSPLVRESQDQSPATK